MRLKNIIIGMSVIGTIVIFAVNAFAFTINVNGDLSEWDVRPDVYGSCDWDPVPGVLYSVEDNHPNAPSGYVGPGYGGQNYDVEGMYLALDNTNLYFAVVTGFPSGGYGPHIPGDLAFDFGVDGFYEYGICVAGRTGFVAGNLYQASSVSDWQNGLFGGVDPMSNPVYLKSGSLASTTPSLVYNNTSYYTGKGNHYVIEGYLPRSAFSGDWDDYFRMHWTMECGNDYLMVTTPEPSTMLLFGLGGLGLGLVRRRRKQGR